MKNSYALVTGATSGIGLEISKDLAKRGYNLILVARTKDRLDSLSSELANDYNIDCDFFPSDLTLINSPNEIYEYTSQKKYNVNISSSFQQKIDQINLKSEKFYLNIEDTQAGNKCLRLKIYKFDKSENIVNSSKKIISGTKINTTFPPNEDSIKEIKQIINEQTK